MCRAHFVLLHVKVSAKRVLCYNGNPIFNYQARFVELVIKVIQRTCRIVPTQWKHAEDKDIACEIVPLPYLQRDEWSCALWCVLYMHYIARRIPLCAVDITQEWKATVAWHIFVKHETIKAGVMKDGINKEAFMAKWVQVNDKDKLTTVRTSCLFPKSEATMLAPEGGDNGKLTKTATVAAAPEGGDNAAEKSTQKRKKDVKTGDNDAFNKRSRMDVSTHMKTKGEKRVEAVPATVPAIGTEESPSKRIRMTRSTRTENDELIELNPRNVAQMAVERKIQRRLPGHTQTITLPRDCLWIENEFISCDPEFKKIIKEFEVNTLGFPRSVSNKSSWIMMKMGTSFVEMLQAWRIAWKDKDEWNSEVPQITTSQVWSGRYFL